MGIRVKTIVADHDLTFIGNMGGRSGYEFQIIHPLHFGSLFPVLIRDLASLFRKEEPLERKQRPDHVFADSLCVPLGCSPDLAVDVETGMAPAENLLDQGEADELFPKQQGEDLMGEELSNKVIMETRDTMEDTLWSCASFSYKDMNVGVEIDSEDDLTVGNIKQELLPYPIAPLLIAKLYYEYICF